MKTETTIMTAAKAREFLANNQPFERGAEGTNRPINLRKVNEYALEMLRGNWKLTHQGIAFDIKGRLKDGQHRLLAILQAAEEGAFEGETKIEANPKLRIQMQVTYGLAEDIFDRLDIGLPRSSQQILAMAGYPNQLHLAATARLLYLFDNHEHRYWRSVKVTNREILETVRNSGIDQYIPICSPLIPIGLIASAATVGYYVCERALPVGPHEQFIVDLREGAGLDSTSPVLAFRNYLIRSKTRDKTRRDAHTHLALYIKAWNDYVGGIRRTIVSWRAGEDFPKPVTEMKN